MVKDVLARITNETFNKFAPLISGLNYLTSSNEFILNKRDSDSDCAHYEFSIKDDPHLFLDMWIGKDQVFISNPDYNDILMGFDCENNEVKAALREFKNNVDAFLCIKDFIKDNDPNFSPQKIDNITQAHKQIIAFEDQLKQIIPSYNHD